MTETPETQPEPAQPEPEIGLAELSVRSVLAKDWRSVSIETEQRGPDGSEVLSRGLLLFLVCPICAATVAAPTEEANLPREHGLFHIRQAKDFDSLNRVIEILQGLVYEAEHPDRREDHIGPDEGYR